MSDFAKAWTLSRQRFVDEIKDLNGEQLRWKLHADSLSIGEMALHVAGIETSFGTQILDKELTPEQAKLKRAATEGVVNSNPFPFAASEIDAPLVLGSLEASKAIVEPLITEPSPAVLTKQIQSALGPIITGEGAFARLSFHSAYHQGQAYLIKTSPGFPG